MKKKILFLLAVILIVVAFFGYRFLYHDHRDVSTEDASFTMTVTELQAQFVSNDSLANSKYADKTFEINGKVSSIDLPTKTITIDEKLSAVMKYTPDPAIKPGDALKIKGRFVGYDDLLEELKMDQVSLLK